MGTLSLDAAAACVVIMGVTGVLSLSEWRCGSFPDSSNEPRFAAEVITMADGARPVLLSCFSVSSMRIRDKSICS